MIIIKNYKKNIKRFKRKIYFEHDEKNKNVKNKYILYPNTNGNLINPNEKKIIFSNFFHIEDREYTKKEMLDTYHTMNNILSKNYKEIDLRKFKSIFDYIVDLGVQKIRNKARIMSELDREFNKSMQYGWQEVFKFKEEREGKTILTFDVNSQYPDAMTKGNYTRLDKMKEEIAPLSLDKYTNGQALVSIEITDDWFLNIFPRYKYFDGVRYYNTDKILNNIWMNIDEIKTYSKYFKITKISKVIYSDESIEHYLSNTIRHFYALRLASTKGSIIEKIIKNILVGLHSVTNGTSNRDYRKEFNNKEEMFNFLQEMNLPISEIKDIPHIDNNSFKVNNIYEKDNTLMLEYSQFDAKNRSIINSLCSTLFANSRIKIFQLIELLKETNIPHELCYINIDSLHISIDKENKDKILKLLEEKQVLGKELGQWKLEAVADKGLWFEPGRYWLYNNNNKLVKAANIVIYDGKEESYLNESRKITYIDEFGFKAKTPHYVYFGFVSKEIRANNFKRVNSLDLENRIKITKIKRIEFKNLKKKIEFQN